MNEKFTKGKWFIQGDFVKSIVDGIPKNICHVFGRPQDVMMSGNTEAQANADLISAAPDLLLAAREYCIECKENDFVDHECKSCFVCKAIRKALGEENGNI